MGVAEGGKQLGSATPRGLPLISCCTVAVSSTVDGLQSALMRRAGGVSLCG